MGLRADAGGPVMTTLEFGGANRVTTDTATPPRPTSPAPASRIHSHDDGRPFWVVTCTCVKRDPDMDALAEAIAEAQTDRPSWLARSVRRALVKAFPFALFSGAAGVLLARTGVDLAGLLPSPALRVAGPGGRGGQLRGPRLAAEQHDPGLRRWPGRPGRAWPGGRRGWPGQPARPGWPGRRGWPTGPRSGRSPSPPPWSTCPPRPELTRATDPTPAYPRLPRA
jgi:hypothetical protein